MARYFLVLYPSPEERNLAINPKSVTETYNRTQLEQIAETYSREGFVGFHTGDPPTLENKVSYAQLSNMIPD